jgi:hypothetical protein
MVSLGFIYPSKVNHGTFELSWIQIDDCDHHCGAFLIEQTGLLSCAAR